MPLSRHSLIPIAVGAVLALSACGGETADTPDAVDHEQPSLAVCPSAEQADALVDLWATEELEELEDQVQTLVAEDEKAASCAGAKELSAFEKTLGPAIGYVDNPDDYVDTVVEEGYPDANASEAFHAWLAAIGRDDVNVNTVRKEAREAAESAEAASDRGAVLAGQEKVGFSIGECPLDDDLCDLRDFSDDDDSTNGVILLETQFSDEPGFSGVYFDAGMREKITNYLKEWMPSQIKKVKLYYYGDKKGDMEATDVEPYATIDLK